MSVPPEDSTLSSCRSTSKSAWRKEVSTENVCNPLLYGKGLISKRWAFVLDFSAVRDRSACRTSRTREETKR